MNLPQIIADTRKFLVALAGILAQILAAGLLHGTAQAVAQTVAAIVAAVLVYLVPNGPTGGLTASAGGVDELGPGHPSPGDVGLTT